MSADDLVRIANQIARFFEPYPEVEAVDGIAEHLEKFWAPSMRKELLALSNGLDPQGAALALHPLVRQAVRRERPHSDG
jgi:formate dehydrogenase subunit delta